MMNPQTLNHDDPFRTTGAPPLPEAHTVLVVDDDARIRKALTRALRAEPYELLAAESGAQAIQILATEKIQVVISDLNMPAMDGIALLSAVADRMPDVVRLVLSGQSNSSRILDAINNGSIYRYILKPWDDDHLKIVIRQAIDLWNLQAEREALLDSLRTHNYRLEELVAQRTRQMLAAERQAEIGRYASQIVHNLSNPLHAVSAALQLMETYVDVNRPDKAKLQKGLTIARSAADDLRDIIAGILSHSREEKQFSIQPLDVNSVIEKEVAFFELIPDFKYNIQKKLILDREIPRIRGNPVQIKQILDNLIKNAVDAMEEAPVKQLTVETVAEDGRLLIRVADTGQGIDLQHMERIFSSDFTTKPPDKGTGLGLASVKAMVEAYAGTIQVSSVPGKGTTFQIHLPALRPEAQE